MDTKHGHLGHDAQPQFSKHRGLPDGLCCRSTEDIVRQSRTALDKKTQPLFLACCLTCVSCLFLSLSPPLHFSLCLLLSSSSSLTWCLQERGHGLVVQWRCGDRPLYGVHRPNGTRMQQRRDVVSTYDVVHAQRCELRQTEARKRRRGAHTSDGLRLSLADRRLLPFKRREPGVLLERRSRARSFGWVNPCSAHLEARLSAQVAPREDDQEDRWEDGVAGPTQAPPEGSVRPLPYVGIEVLCSAPGPSFPITSPSSPCVPARSQCSRHSARACVRTPRGSGGLECCRGGSEAPLRSGVVA